MFNWSLSISSTTLKSLKSLSPSPSSSSSSSSLSFSRTFLENIIRSSLYQSITSLDKTKLWSKFYVDTEENVQKVLDAVSVDQKVITDPNLNRKRRTVIVTRNNNEPFGFTLQTYLLKRNGDDVASKITYIDYVHLDSPAFNAGIRAGDIIISINGHVVTAMSHEELIKLISSYQQMRMIVIFENIRQRVELVARAIKLRKILNDKLHQLNLIDIEEQKILNTAYLRSLSVSKTKYANSLSSGGTSSNSSLCSAIANTNEITNDIKRSRMPAIISLTHIIEIRRYSLGKQSSEKSSLLEIFSRKPLENSESNLSDSKITNTEMESVATQQDVASSMFCDLRQITDCQKCFVNPCDDDNNDNDNNVGNISNNSCIIIIENDNDDSKTVVVDDDVDIRNATDNDDKTNVFDSMTTTTTTTLSVPVSESLFNSVALNHVIRLDHNVISDDDDDNDDNSDKIKIIKL